MSTAAKTSPAREEAPLKAPTAAEVDKLATEYVQAKAKFITLTLESRDAGKRVDEIEARIIPLVRQFGSAHAEKSKLLHGLKWELMGTFGSSTSIDAAAVERLRLRLVKGKATRLLGRLFEATTRWSLTPTARAEILKVDVPAEVRSDFAACEVTKERSPKIEARPKEKP
jgi:hypothetical protein